MNINKDNYLPDPANLTPALAKAQAEQLERDERARVASYAKAAKAAKQNAWFDLPY